MQTDTHRMSLRFNYWRMMLLCSLVSSLCVALGCTSSSDQAHRRAVEALGGVHETDHFLGINDVSFSGEKFTDEQLAESLQHLDDLNVVGLYLIDTKVSARALRQLHILRNLRIISLRGKHINDRHVEALAGLTKVTCLDFRDSSVTDAGITHLKGLKALSMLNLSGTLITDKAIDALVTHSDLQVLALDRTDVTDTGIKLLSRLDQLEYVSLWKTNTTAQGVSDLQKLLPECQIMTVPPTMNDRVPPENQIR